MFTPCLQYCGGTSFIAKLVEGLQPNMAMPTVLIDLFGFDAWPGLYSISQSARGHFFEPNCFSFNVMVWLGPLENPLQVPRPKFSKG